MRGCRMWMQSSPKPSGEASSEEQQDADASCSWYLGETRMSIKLVTRSCRDHHTSVHKPVSTIYVLFVCGVDRLGAECHSSHRTSHGSFLTTYAHTLQVEKTKVYMHHVARPPFYSRIHTPVALFADYCHSKSLDSYQTTGSAHCASRMQTASAALRSQWLQLPKALQDHQSARSIRLHTPGRQLFGL